MVPETPKFEFIRKLCPLLSEDELRTADAAFLAYVNFILEVCERATRESEQDADSAD